MNIVIANTQEFNPLVGGVERVSSSLANEFIRVGHKVIFVACVVSQYGRNYIPVAKQYILPQSNYNCSSNIEAFKKIIANEQIDIVLNQAGNIKEFTALCAQSVDYKEKKSIPLISAIHISPNNRMESLRDFRYSKVYPFSYLMAARRALLYPFRYKRILGITEDTYSYVCKVSSSVVVLSKQYMVQLKRFADEKDWHKIVAIGNFLYINKERCKNKKNIILYVGRMDFGHKRPDRLIEIWRKVYKRYPEWELHMVGDGPMRSALERYVTHRGIKNVKFLGMKNPSDEYENASILCITSTIEGFPMVLLEGMEKGCVPISYDSFAAVYDIIKSGVNGIIVPKFNESKYIKELCCLMDSAVLRKRFSKQAIDSISEFGTEEITSRWFELFKGLC